MPKNKSKKQTGGYNSGWSYVYDQVGNGWTQFQNALTIQPGQNLGTVNSNDLEPIGKPNFENTQGVPTTTQLALVQRAGKRRRSGRGGNFGAVLNQAAAPLTLLTMQQYNKKGKGKRGGNFGAVLNQAAAPLTLLALQQSRKKRTLHKKSKKSRTKKQKRTRRR